ncbi:MAG: hypothetical protein AB1457_17745 [Chloroflexota bacterium]
MKSKRQYKYFVSGIVNRPQRTFALFVLFVLALFIDYGGGIGVKPVTFLGLFLVLIMSLKTSLRVYRVFIIDLVVYLVLPCIMLALHAFNFAWRADLFLQIAYHSLSSQLVILFLPLIALSGSLRCTEFFKKSFRLISVLICTIYLLHFIGVIDIVTWVEVANSVRIGFIGIDPRAKALLYTERVNLTPSIAYAIPFVAGIEWITAPLWGILVLVASMIVNSRAIFVSSLAVFVCVFFIVLTRRIRRKKNVLGMFIVLFLLAVIITQVNPLGMRLSWFFEERMKTIVYEEDLSYTIRTAHLEAAKEKLASDVLGILIGLGPSWAINNRIIGWVQYTEISFLNLILTFGLPYALLYCGYFLWQICRLFRLRRQPGFGDSDRGLLLGSFSFFLVANTNPVMVSPIYFIIIMLLRTRIRELVHMDDYYMASRREKE